MFDSLAKKEWRENYGVDYDDKKFWVLFDWIQQKKKGKKYSVTASAKNIDVFVSHLKYYIDTVKEHHEFNQIEFNQNYSMFKVKN